MFWWFNAVVTPLTIPNREVKHRCSDGTALRESSYPPEQRTQLAFLLAYVTIIGMKKWAIIMIVGLVLGGVSQVKAASQAEDLNAQIADVSSQLNSVLAQATPAEQQQFCLALAQTVQALAASAPSNVHAADAFADSLAPLTICHLGN